MRNHFQFRTSSMLIVAAFFAMAYAVIATRLELNRLRASITASDSVAMPIPADVVSVDVGRYLASHPLPVSVIDVRYSDEQDTFKVWFSYTDPTDSSSRISSFDLKGDGYGGYVGCIRNTAFLTPISPPRYSPPLADGDGMWVSVSTPPNI